MPASRDDPEAAIPLVVEIDAPDPIVAAERLRKLGGMVFLDSAMRHGTLGRYSYVAASPFSTFTVDATGPRLDGEPLAEPPLDALDRLLSRYRTATIPDAAPFQGGAIGFFGYEFAHHLEKLRRPSDFDPSASSLRFDLYDTVLAYDHERGRAFLFSSGYPAQGVERSERAADRLREFSRALASPPTATDERSSAADIGAKPRRSLDWRSNFLADDYRAAIEKVRTYILDGDIYQANIAQTFTARLSDGFDPFELYKRLRRTNAAPFGAYLDYCDAAVASSSPERFLRLTGRSVETRPIKGTAKRSSDPACDRVLAEALAASEKDRAENVMIVDLLRNDLSRVCTPDSVEVPVLCGLESYAAVHHLVSVVTGTLKEGVTVGDLIAATFPGGSITGAPKIRAMDIIAEIEDAARGPYCGSIGFIGFDGELDLNIAIRTLAFSRHAVKLSAGGGITILSDAAAEYEETFTKAQRVFAAFEPQESAIDR